MLYICTIVIVMGDLHEENFMVFDETADELEQMIASLAKADGKTLILKVFREKCFENLKNHLQTIPIDQLKSKEMMDKIKKSVIIGRGKYIEWIEASKYKRTRKRGNDYMKTQAKLYRSIKNSTNTYIRDIFEEMKMTQIIVGADFEDMNDNCDTAEELGSISISASATVTTASETKLRSNNPRRKTITTYHDPDDNDNIWAYGLSGNKRGPNRRTTKIDAAASVSVSIGSIQANLEAEVSSSRSSSLNQSTLSAAAGLFASCGRNTRSSVNLMSSIPPDPPSESDKNALDLAIGDSVADLVSDKNKTKDQTNQKKRRRCNSVIRSGGTKKHNQLLRSKDVVNKSTVSYKRNIRSLRVSSKMKSQTNQITLPQYQHFENEFIHICEEPRFKTKQIRQVDELFNQAFDIIYKPGMSKADLRREWQYGFLHKKSGVYINVLGMQPDLVNLPRRVYDLDNLDK
jgi:hypothetical protein